MYKFILAFRYLRKRPIAYLAMSAVAISVFIVMVVMTVINGLVRQYTENNHKLVGDCVIVSDSLVGFPYYEQFMEMLESQDYVEATSPVITSFALVSQPMGNVTYGKKLVGIDPARHEKVVGFSDYLYYNRDNFLDVFKSDDPAVPGCVAPASWVWSRQAADGTYQRTAQMPAHRLDMTCFPLAPSGAPLKGGTDIVSSKMFVTTDDAQTGIARVDSDTIFVPFDELQVLTGMSYSQPRRISSIYVKFRDDRLDFNTAAIRTLWNDFVKSRSGQPLANLLENVSVQSWKQYRREAIAPMEKEQLMLTVMFFMLGVVTVFVVLVVFYMIVSHKSRDIGILRSFGVSRIAVLKLYEIYALQIGLCGSLLGVGLGTWFLVKINDIERFLFAKTGFQLWDRTMFNIGEIPNQIHWQVVCVIAISAIAACLVGALLPAWQACAKRPVEILRVDQL